MTDTQFFIQEKKLACPYCGELIDILVDTSVEQQTYIEDCHVCCRPINLNVSISFDGNVCVMASHENE